MANPLRPDEPITFPKGKPEDAGVDPGIGIQNEGWWRCTSPHVRLVRVGEMAGNLEGVFAVDYRPLVATEDGSPKQADLSFDIEELGTYRCACCWRCKIQRHADGFERFFLFLLDSACLHT